MRLICLPALAFAVGCAYGSAANSSASPPVVHAIVGATLIDGTGVDPLPNSVILFRDGRVLCAGTPNRCQVPRDASVVAAYGLWAIPGLIDVHIHLTGSDRDYDARLLLAAGITTARDAGTFAPGSGTYAIGRGQIERVAIISRHLQQGQLLGPRLCYCGPGFYSWTSNSSDPPWAPWVLLPAEDTNISTVIEHIVAHGATCLKVFGGTQVFGGVSHEHLEALSAAGRARGLSIIGHAQSHMPLQDQLPLMDEIHHTWLQPEDLLDADQLALLPASPGLARTWAAWAIFDPQRPRAKRIAEAVVNAHVAWVPTLAIWDPGFRDNLAWVAGNLFTAAAPPSDSARFNNLLFSSLPPASTRDDTLAVMKAVGGRFARAWTSALNQAGVEILAGSDGGPGIALGDALHTELEYLVQAGLTPMQAVMAATSTAASRLRISDAGVIAPGKRADIVLLEANPLAAISNTRKIAAVVLNGRYRDRQALERLLAPAKAAANR